MHRGLSVYPEWYQDAMPFPLRNTEATSLLLDPEDHEHFTYLGIRPSLNAERGVYFCLHRKKRYIHRFILESQGVPLHNHRVGFLDGLVTNCCRRNLFVYEVTSNPITSRREARARAVDKVKREGFVIY